MNMRPTFDTAKFQSILTDGGVPEAQARAQTSALAGALDEAGETFIAVDRFDRAEMRILNEFEKLRLEFRGELSEKLRVQGLAIIGSVAALIAGATALLKLTG